jgi:hypothetical protein
METQKKCLAKYTSKEQSDLSKELKETMDCECNCRPEKTFSVADLWNIQRRAKTFQRRY